MMTQKTAQGLELIKEKVKTLPRAPGVYRMIGQNQDVLYVGKAKNLKTRVANYTRARGHGQRINTMIRLTRDMEFIRTQSEADALLLEANLIQKFKPRFNVLMRDDKSLPYILLSTEHPIAQLTKHRGAQNRKGHYFGPFASPRAVRRTLNTLQKAFLLRSCEDGDYDRRERPCLLYQIKKCSAPCTGEISADDYAHLARQAQQFLAGENANIQTELAQHMQAASEAQNYELAAQLRDRIHALTYIQSATDIFSRTFDEADIIALSQASGQSCIQVFFFRGGRNLGNKAYFPRHEKDTPAAEILQAFIMQFYEKRPPAKQLFISQSLSRMNLIAEALSIKADKKIRLSHPQRGEKRDLLIHALDNAREALARRLAERKSQQNLLKDVAEIFGLPAPPQRIEVFDNSHLQGTHQIGAMIVATRDGFAKNQYRKFNIRDDTLNGDDYGMMREVLTRRFARLAKTAQSEWPDLVVLDGGKGQLAVGQGVLAELDLSHINMIAMAKGADRNAGRETFFLPNKKTMRLSPDSPALYYLQKLRNEAHRFAIGSHRARRKKHMHSNPLDEIHGIGRKRKQALLHHFGSAKAVAQAALGDLEKVDGVSEKMAQIIYSHFNH